MSWEDQGRQEHGHFGDGKGPEKPKDGGGMFAPNAVADRMTAVIRASVAALPKKSRGSSAAQLNDARTRDFARAMTRWSNAGHLPDADFAAAFFDRDRGDPVVAQLREAAGIAANAKSNADLAKSSVLLAEAQQKIGLDHWRGFVDGAVGRAIQFGEFARAASKTATDAGVAPIGAAAPPGKKAQPPVDAPGEPKGPHIYKRFFDTAYQPISDLAKELGVPEDYILGHAAHESSYLDNHNFPLNNPFGYTAAGRNNLSFSSIADAVAAYRRDYGPQIRGATSAKDFVDRIQGKSNGRQIPGWRIYNTRDGQYELKVLSSFSP